MAVIGGLVLTRMVTLKVTDRRGGITNWVRNVRAADGRPHVPVDRRLQECHQLSAGRCQPEGTHTACGYSAWLADGRL